MSKLPALLAASLFATGMACSSPIGGRDGAATPAPGSTPAATTRTQSLDHILPPRDSMGGTPTRFEWTAIDGADRYSLGIWGEADNMVFRQDNIPTASLAWPPDFKPEMGTYWWQVTALRGDLPLIESGRSAFVINR